jgi:hypothetical protein
MPFLFGWYFVCLLFGIFLSQSYGPIMELGYDDDLDVSLGDHPPVQIAFNDIFKCLRTDLSEFQEELIVLRDFKSTWMTENPGKQLLSGSFEPVETTWEEWVKDACDPALPVSGSNEDNEGGFANDEEEDE